MSDVVLGGGSGLIPTGPTEAEREARALVERLDCTDDFDKSVQIVTAALRAAADRATQAEQRVAELSSTVRTLTDTRATESLRADAAEQECARLREELAAERERWAPAERDARQALRDRVTELEAECARLREELFRYQGGRFLRGTDELMQSKAREAQLRAALEQVDRLLRKSWNDPGIGDMMPVADAGQLIAKTLAATPDEALRVVRRMQAALRAVDNITRSATGTPTEADTLTPAEVWATVRDALAAAAQLFGPADRT